MAGKDKVREASGSSTDNEETMGSGSATGQLFSEPSVFLLESLNSDPDRLPGISPLFIRLTSHPALSSSTSLESVSVTPELDKIRFSIEFH